MNSAFENCYKSFVHTRYRLQSSRVTKVALFYMKMITENLTINHIKTNNRKYFAWEHNINLPLI